MYLREPTIFMLAIAAFFFVITPVVLGLRHARMVHQHGHAERMRALELGQRLPQGDSKWSLARISVAIGAGVPVGVFFCAWMADNPGNSIALWVSAAVVGMTAVICGTVLAGISAYSAEPQSAHLAEHSARKPTFDGDAFEVVASRGGY